MEQEMETSSVSQNSPKSTQTANEGNTTRMVEGSSGGDIPSFDSNCNGDSDKQEKPASAGKTRAEVACEPLSPGHLGAAGPVYLQQDLS